jgi:hypothetical protein
VEAVSVWPTTALPLIAGSAVFTGAVATGAAATRAVWPDTAVAEPPAFVAVTATRSVNPASPLATAYDAAVAPLMAAHDAPELSQRRHWYAYELTPPLQLPVLALSVWPTTALPLIVGSAVFAGEVPVATTPVWADVADVEPATFVAVTTTRIVAPASADCSAYELAVAPLMLTQFAPAESQRRHWYP